MARMSPLERLALYAGIASLFLAVLLGVAALNPIALPSIAEHARAIGYAASGFAGLAIIGMLKAAFDAIRESTVRQKAWRFICSPNLWWPPTRRRIERDRRRAEEVEAARWQLGKATVSVVTRSRRLLEELDSSETKESSEATLEGLWSSLANALGPYSWAIHGAPEEEQVLHREALASLRGMVAEKKLSDQTLSFTIEQLEDWLGMLRKGMTVSQQIDLLFSDITVRRPADPRSTTEPGPPPPS